MKRSGIPCVLGRRIDAVVVARPRADSGIGDQLFLVFDDDTWLEVYGRVQLAGGVSPGGKDAAIDYARCCNAETIDVYESGLDARV